MASTSRRVMSASTISMPIIALPVTDRAGVEVDEARARIEADATHVERARHLADLEGRETGEHHVDGVAVDVLAVRRHAATDACQPRVGRGRTVCRQHL